MNEIDTHIYLGLISFKSNLKPVSFLKLMLDGEICLINSDFMALA